MRRHQKLAGRPIVLICTLVCMCTILVLLRSGKTPVFLSFGKRAAADASSTGRYFYNRTAIRHKNLTDVRQCYHVSRVGLLQLLDSESRDILGCKQRLPQALIVGVRSSGERRLTFFLRTHPSVKFTFDDDVHYFDWVGRNTKGIDWYENKMPYASPDQVTIESGASYFDSSTAPDGIRNDIVPRPKLIVVLRDPVKRALRDFDYSRNEDLSDGTLEKPWIKMTKQYPFLNSKVYLEDTFAQSVIGGDGKVNSWNGLVNRGMYVIHLRRWIEYFGRTQIQIIDGDRLEEDPVPILNEVEDFLGVPRYFKDDVVGFDKSVQTHCLRKPFHYCPFTKVPEHTAADPSTEQALRTLYRRYDRQLYQMLGRNFTWFDLSGIFGNKPLAEEAIPAPDDVDDVEQSSDQLVEDEDGNTN